jgi:hypothetical protein
MQNDKTEIGTVQTTRSQEWIMRIEPFYKSLSKLQKQKTLKYLSNFFKKNG